jgi:hypothetical protein
MDKSRPIVILKKKAVTPGITAAHGRLLMPILSPP